MRRRRRTYPLVPRDAALPASPISPEDLETARRRGAELVESGESLRACDFLDDALTRFPGDVRLRQLDALALARTGAVGAAQRILLGLVQEQHADAETIGLLARTHKDLWAEATDPAERAHHLTQAHGFYADAFRTSGGYWTGINAATTALIGGDRDRAAALAREVRARCLRQQHAPDGDAYWIAATLGEAALILGEWREAEDRYAEAAALGRRRFGALASTRRNARLILEYLRADPAWIARLIPIPRVAAFAGHLVDAPGRPAPRFPPQIATAVRAAIDERVAALDIGFGFASGACGGDILFLESVLARGGEVHVVLPYDRDQFVRDSVDVVPGADWVARFERVLDRAATVVSASSQRAAASAVLYEYALQIIDGTAGLRADEIDSDLVAIALWDGHAGDGPGGTASAVEHWRRAGRQLDILDIAAIRGREHPELASPAAAGPATCRTRGRTAGGTRDPEIVTVLFGDARGFSTLTDDQILAFSDAFLGTVAAEIERLPSPPCLKNTWGDGLFLAFTDVRQAGLFALRLCRVIAETDWSAHRLPRDLGVRIGLHAGPAYACTDPVTGRRNYLGTHVSHGARIEPITPPGHAYASRAFAALARANDVREFSCEYVGQTPYAKGYGTYPLYVVRQRRRLDP